MYLSTSTKYKYTVLDPNPVQHQSICDLIAKQSVSVRTRRAEDCYLLSVPPISKYCANSFLIERSFMYAAPTLRNKLSQDIRMLNFVRFKSSIKTELYLKNFEA